MGDGLAQRLKAATHELHFAVERGALMCSLIGGPFDRGAYLGLLRDLQALYAALEAALTRHAGHPAIAPLWLDGLARLPGLERDLETLHGAAWRTQLAPSAGARAYVQRLQQLDAAAPLRLAAHAYVRYLGDLSGGRLLARRVGAALALAPGEGTAFYDFGGAAQAQRLAHTFRAGLGRVPGEASTVAALVGEARRAFEMHRTMFDELARCHGLGGAPVFSAAG